MRWLFGVIILISLLAAGCGGASDVEDAQVEDAQTVSTSDAESPTAAGGGESEMTDGGGDAEAPTVALIVHFQSPFTEQIADGARTAADEFGAELIVSGPPQFDAPAAIGMWTDAVAADAQGGAVVPFPEDVWQRTIDDSIASGVPMVALNVPAPESDIPLYVGVNEVEIGRQMGQAAIDDLGDDTEGSFVVGNCAPGVQVLDDRVDGVKEIVEQSAPGITVEGGFDTTADPASNFSAWEALVQRYPDAVAYIGVCDPDLPNLIRLKERDPNAEYAIVGANFVPETIQGLKDGVATASVGQSPFMQGYVPIRAVLEQLVNGQEVPEGWIDSGVEVVTPEGVEALEERESSMETTLEYYLPLAEDIFSDLENSVRPLSEYGQ